MQGLLEGINIKLLDADNKLNEIGKSEAVFKFGTEDIKARLNALAIHLKEQKDFLLLYLTTAAANRQSLFYTKQVSKKLL